MKKKRGEKEEEMQQKCKQYSTTNSAAQFTTLHFI